MILAELKKIKRHYLLPLSIGVVVLSCLLALIQLTGAENSVVGYLRVKDGILWNNGTCGAFVYGFCGIFVANTRFTSWYPTTSGLTIIKYEPNFSNYQMSAAIFVLAVCLFFSLLIITVARRNLYD